MENNSNSYGHYFQVNLSFDSSNANLEHKIFGEARDKFECTGIVEMDLSEAEINKYLGKEVFHVANDQLNIEQELFQHVDSKTITLFFDAENDGEMAKHFTNFVQSNYPYLSPTISKQKNQDWNEEWKKSYKSFDIGESFKIVPVWEKEEFFQRIPIYINPGMGFGTGTHETTQICLELFEKISEELLNNTQKNNTVLDFGCGSGILGIAVKKTSNLCNVTFYDIDQDALKNTECNLALNNIDIGEKIVVTKELNGNLALDEKYKLIFANILLNVLVDQSELISSITAPNGFLILSGILYEQREIIELEYKRKGFSLINFIKKNDWCGFLLKKNDC